MVTYHKLSKLILLEIILYCDCDNVRCAGLGTSTSKEAKEYFSDMVRHRIPFKYAGTEDDASIVLVSDSVAFYLLVHMCLFSCCSLNSEI